MLVIHSSDYRASSRFDLEFCFHSWLSCGLIKAASVFSQIRLSAGELSPNNEWSRQSAMIFFNVQERKCTSCYANIRQPAGGRRRRTALHLLGSSRRQLCRWPLLNLCSCLSALPLITHLWKKQQEQSESEGKGPDWTSSIRHQQSSVKGETGAKEVISAEKRAKRGQMVEAVAIKLKKKNDLSYFLSTFTMVF